MFEWIRRLLPARRHVKTFSLFKGVSVHPLDESGNWIEVGGAHPQANEFRKGDFILLKFGKTVGRYKIDVISLSREKDVDGVRPDDYRLHCTFAPGNTGEKS